MITRKEASEFFHVRMVCRGYWTYDLYIPESVPEFSVGEASSRKEAERKATQAVNRLLPEDYRH